MSPPSCLGRGGVVVFLVLPDAVICLLLVLSSPSWTPRPSLFSREPPPGSESGSLVPLLDTTRGLPPPSVGSGVTGRHPVPGRGGTGDETRVHTLTLGGLSGLSPETPERKGTGSVPPGSSTTPDSGTRVVLDEGFDSSPYPPVPTLSSSRGDVPHVSPRVHSRPSSP